MRTSCLPFLALAVILLTSCVENRAYRLGDLNGPDPDQLPYFEQKEVSAGHSYRLSFVEFDEKGDFWDRRQLGKAARTVRSSARPVLLVLYVHGWHHNANNRKPPGDVETFQCLLSQLAVSESTRQLQVHGIYLGWRGRAVTGNLDYLTIYNRKAAATRVAGTPVTETIFELIRQARKSHPGQSKCVLIGHSLGGLVLEKAMAQAMTGTVLAQDVQSGGGQFNAPADLVLLVNSAAESIYAKEMRDMFQRTKQRRGSGISPDQPLMISITSESDTATSRWFPFGTFFPNIFAHRRYDWDTRYDSASHDVDQNEYLTKTPGHNTRLFSHQIVPTAAPPDAPSPGRIAQMEKPELACLEPNPAFEQNLQYPHGLTFATGDAADARQFKWWRLERFGADPTTPYWIMHVPKEIIPNHTPIFTPQSRAMMAALFRLTNPKGSGTRQMQLQAQSPSVEDSANSSTPSRNSE
jgi:alpha-beta hydrolase superfamily lysophospholipase